MGKFNLGFSLIELIVCIAISSVLGLIAVPAFNDLYQRRRIEVAAVQIDELFRASRAIAIYKNINVTICAGVNDPNGVTLKCIASSRSTDWSHSAIAYTDPLGVNDYRKEGREQRIKFESTGVSNLKITADSRYYVHPDSTISSSITNRKKFCFYFQANSSKEPLKGLLLLDKYGNSRYCNNYEYNDCVKECQ